MSITVYTCLIWSGEDGVALLVGEEDGGGYEESLDGLPQPPHQLSLGGQAGPHIHTQVDLGQRVRHQPEPEHEITTSSIGSGILNRQRTISDKRTMIRVEMMDGT